jgi:DNA-binding GntR family transcriptional regulator
MTEGKIIRQTLHDQVAARLRELIQTGELKPRERLNESALSERLGVSRTPLREAIKVLATEGLLDLLPNRGSQVASFSQTEIDEMLEVIAALEGAAAELACRNAAQQDLAAITALHSSMVSAHAAGDAARYADLNRNIHDALIRASGNGVLQGLYANLSSRIQRARFAAHKTPAQWQAALDEHAQMIDLLNARSGEALAALMRKHVRNRRAEIAATFAPDQP